MALWQFPLTVLGADRARIGGVDAISLHPQELRDTTLAIGYERTEHLLAGLSALLPEREPWAHGVRVWGDVRSDDAQLYIGAYGRIEEAQVRFDAVALSLPLVRAMCAVLRSCDCVFVSEDGVILRPSGDAVIRALLNSAARRYVVSRLNAAANRDG